MISSFDELLIAVKGDFTQLLRVNLNIGPFLMKEKMARIERREELREALRTCGSGNEASKIFVKNYITSLLSEKYKISEENIGLFLMEDAEYKFKLMLEKSIAKYGKLGLEKLIDIYFSEVINRHNKRDIGERELNRAFTKIRNHQVWQVYFKERYRKPFLC